MKVHRPPVAVLWGNHVPALVDGALDRERQLAEVHVTGLKGERFTWAKSLKRHRPEVGGAARLDRVRCGQEAPKLFLSKRANPVLPLRLAEAVRALLLSAHPEGRVRKQDAVLHASLSKLDRAARISLSALSRKMPPITDLRSFARQAILAAALTNGGWTVIYVAEKSPKAPQPEPPKKAAGTPAPVIPLRPAGSG